MKALQGVQRWWHVGQGLLVDVALLATVFASGIALGSVLLEQFVIKPRIAQTVNSLTVQISAIRAAYTALPDHGRSNLLASVALHSGEKVTLAGALPTGAGEPVLPALRQGLRQLREQLPGVRLHAVPWPRSELWFSLGPHDQPAPWMVMRMAPLVRDLIPLLGAAVLLVLAAAAMLAYRTLQRWAWLGQALDDLDAETSTLPTQAGPEVSDDDIAVLRGDLQRLAKRLAHARNEQLVFMACVASDLGKALQDLRAAQPRSPQAVQVGREFDAMIQAAGELDGFARQRADAPKAATHLNDVLMSLTLPALPQGGPAVRWSLGGLPYAGLGQTQARRLFSHLLDHLLEQGQGPLEVSSGLENNWIVVRARGRGHASDPVPATPDRLGLAVASRIAEAHDGFLLVQREQDGALVAEVWLPPARLS